MLTRFQADPQGLAFRNVPLKSLHVLKVTSHPIAVETMNILATNRAKVYHFLYLKLVHKVGIYY